jgi:hypothetical protein
VISDYWTNTFSRYTLAPAVTFPYDLTSTLIGTFAGSISKLNAREQWLDEKMTVHASHLITCASSTTLDEADEIKLGTRTFLIRYVDPVEIKTGHHLEVFVDEVI